jgi:hypothetical protein
MDVLYRQAREPLPFSLICRNHGSNLFPATVLVCSALLNVLFGSNVTSLQQPVGQWWPNSRSRSLFFFKIAYLKHNWRCKLGMHDLSSVERNGEYWRFFELLNNPPGLYQVILNLLSVSYRKIRSVMHQLHNRKVSEKHHLIMVNCFSSKISIFNKVNNYTFICLMLLCYFTFHCLVDLILNYVLW